MTTITLQPYEGRLLMSIPVVETFLLDDDNEEKFWRRGLDSMRVLQVLDNRHRIKRNRKARRASHLLVGRDHHGQCIAIPIEPTHEPGVWRPVTAWPCKHYEAVSYTHL